MESNNLPEELKQCIASCCVRKIGDRGRPGPRDDGREEDSNEYRPTDPVKNEESCENPERISDKIEHIAYGCLPPEEDP